MHLEGAECLAQYDKNFYAGMPAIARNQFGKGCTYYLGTNMNQEGIAKVLDLATQSAGVMPVIDEQTGLEVTCRKADNCTYYFIFNFKDQEIALPERFVGCTDLLTGETVEAGKLLNQYDAYLFAVTA